VLKRDWQPYMRWLRWKTPEKCSGLEFKKSNMLV
jgi:hypothetical protein